MFALSVVALVNPFSWLLLYLLAFSFDLYDILGPGLRGPGLHLVQGSPQSTRGVNH